MWEKVRIHPLCKRNADNVNIFKERSIIILEWQGKTVPIIHNINYVLYKYKVNL